MYVTSIADLERAQEVQEDAVLDSAVDQLEALADPDGSGSHSANIMIRFGQMNLDEHQPLLRFAFESATTWKSWPGPRYGFLPLHKKLVETSKLPKLHKSRQKPTFTKKHGQPEDWKQSHPPRKVPKPKTIMKVREQPSKRETSVASRNPPLDLLSLPAELRVLIYNNMSLHPGPLECQIRRVRLCKKSAKSEMLRHFPREPAVAMVNRQLRREVLSVFYGGNSFILKRRDCTMLKGLSITNPNVLSKWKPDMSSFLTHLIIEYRASSRAFQLSHDFFVVYELRRLVSGKITIELKCTTAGGRTSSVQCLCHESDVLAQVGHGTNMVDLVEVAVDLLRTRNESLSGIDAPRTEKFFPVGEICEKCGKTTFYSIQT